MASMTAAACACIISSTTTAPAAHCGRASSAHLASSSSFSTLLAAAPLKNRTSVPPLLKRLSHGRGFGSLCIAPSGEDASWAGVIRAFPGGDDNRDDAGVIKDMELYLDDLSLEYDSVWDTKPAWCQPWTIVGTGVVFISASWLPFHNAFVTGGVTLIMGLWWYSFLYVYPQGYSEMIAERRSRMENGSEDTYGVKRE